MAKYPKSKDEKKKESKGCVVLHQKLCLSIDMDAKRIIGHTELKVRVMEAGSIALYADDMTIRAITIDGEPVEFEHLPHFVADYSTWSSVSCCKMASDAACSTYLSLLKKEMVPNLVIPCDSSKKSASKLSEEDKGKIAQNSYHLPPFFNECSVLPDDKKPVSKHGQEDKGKIVQNLPAEKVSKGYSALLEDKNVKEVHIGFLIARTGTGIHFGENVMHTNNQIRRARCWFPCIDDNSQRCTFDMECTVNSNYVAVSNGTLLYKPLLL